MQKPEEILPSRAQIKPGTVTLAIFTELIEAPRLLTLGAGGGSSSFAPGSISLVPGSISLLSNALANQIISSSIWYLAARAESSSPGATVYNKPSTPGNSSLCPG